jgi:hypothetical protein
MGLGFRNGLAGTAGSIQATARNLANSAASTIQRALRIHSPSRVTEELGEYTGDGLVEGMKNRIRAVERIAGEMAQKALPRIDVGRSLGSIGLAAAGGPSYASPATDETIVVEVYTTVELDKHKVSKDLAEPIKVEMRKSDIKDAIIKKGRP